jgi:hypothetical protein
MLVLSASNESELDASFAAMAQQRAGADPKRTLASREKLRMKTALDPSVKRN